MSHINTKCQNITIKLILDYFYFKQEIRTSYLHGCLGSPPVYIGGVNVAHLFSFLCYVFCFVCHLLVYPMLPVSLDQSIQNYLSLRFSLKFTFQIFKLYSWFNVNSQYNLLLTKLLKVTDKCCYTYIRPMLSYHQHLDAWFPRVQ